MHFTAFLLNDTYIDSCTISRYADYTLLSIDYAAISFIRTMAYIELARNARLMITGISTPDFFPAAGDGQSMIRFWQMQYTFLCHRGRHGRYTPELTFFCYII